MRFAQLARVTPLTRSVARPSNPSARRAAAPSAPIAQPVPRGYHRAVRRRISTPAEVLPRWWAAIEAEVIVPVTRDIFWFGMYTGMRRGEIMALCWDRVDRERRILRVEATKTGEPPELPITRQLVALLERRRLDASAGNGDAHRWVFPSTGTSGHVVELQHLYRRITRAAGTKFWFMDSGTCSSRWRSGS